MNSTFDIKRFWNLLKNDLYRIATANSTKLIAYVIGPIAIYLVVGFARLIFGEGWFVDGDGLRQTLYGVFGIVFAVSCPSMMYGFLTDKKLGPSYLLLPCSRLEKFVSMILVTVVIVPAVFSLGCGIVDSLFCLIDPASSLTYFKGIGHDVLVTDPQGFVHMSYFSLVVLIFLIHAENCLFFLLGAITFKKNKVANTFLSMIGLSVVAMVLMVIFATLAEKVDVSDVDVSPKMVEVAINTLINIVTIIPCFVLGWGVWYRLKTIKH